MSIKKKIFGLMTAMAITVSLSTAAVRLNSQVSAADDISSTMTWDSIKIGGAGFTSGIVAGQNEMYLRTDVGGAYKYNYKTMKWEQLLAFLNEADRGLLSVKGMAIDPTDDNIVYFLCGCAYFSETRTEIFKTTDGGKTFERHDVTDLIQVHGNGDGRECIEPIAVDPDNPNIIYAGGDVTRTGCGLIKSTDGGKTWKDVEGYKKLGLFSGQLKYPMWTEDLSYGTEPTKQYNEQNGIGVILIEDGKVYVGTSVVGQTNIHVADVSKDEFTECSKDLPNDNYPLSITSDHNGNLFFTYIQGLAFGGMAGGAYKYEKASGKVTKLSVSDKAIGMIEVDPNDPKKMVARTCGVWGAQLYEEWTEEVSPAWGDNFFRSTDGGETWQDITPGASEGPWGEKWLVSNYMGTNGYDWIYGKSCHWGSSIVMDPRNPEHIYLTSGNGVFRCDNIWDEKGVQFYFDPNGVEEVVALDMVSVPGRNPFSAIGDYDGFEHLDVSVIGLQYKPNMGSTAAIAYCPQNPDVMLRIAEGDANNQASGYYSMDGGKTWEGMKVASGGKAAITQLSEGKYRFLKSGKESGAVSYSDDFGATWKEATGISGYKPSYFLVDPKDPSLIYASAIIYNQYWSSNPNVTEPTFEECHHSAFISHDYGATWTETPITKYDCWSDAPGDPAYLSEGKVVYACGWGGLYITEDEGKTFKSLDVNFAKTVGYGAPEKSGGPNTLFIYGKPSEADPEGIYRSSDGGKTWVCINTNKLYGGTGNGNFLVGDMNEFGTVYMSTVGAGIVYGKLTSNIKEPPVTEPTEAPTKPVTTKPAVTTTAAVPTEAPATTIATDLTEVPAATTAVTVPVSSPTDKPSTDKPVSSDTTVSTEEKVTTEKTSAETTGAAAETTEVPATTGKATQGVITTITQPVTTASKPAPTTAEPEETEPTETTVLNTVQITLPSDVKATLYGDVNLDGAVNVSDVVALNLYLLNQSKYSLKAEALANADCAKNGVVNISDSTILMNYVAEIISYDELGK